MRCALLLMLLTVSPVLAAETPPLPRPRPVVVAPVPAPAPAPVAVPATAGPVGEGSAVPQAAEPPAPRDYQTACPAAMTGQVTAKMLAPIHEGQCGLQSPLSLEAVSANGRSIPLDAPAITDCGMASALPGWVAEVDSYVFATDKTRLKRIDVSTGYMCRNVDNAKTGNLSFHSFADALDIVGFDLEDGRHLSLKDAWRGTPAQGNQIWHFAHDAACTHFMTVLGPDADSFHQDNLHLDLACHGKACVTRLCQ